MSFRPLGNDEGYDMPELNRALDIAKTKAFLGNNGAFLGPLMCGMEFIWTKDVETAATDGIHVWWNPDDFLSLTEDLRTSTVLHELWHPANLHFIRQGDRNPQTWNIACDIDINNNLKADGYKVEKPWFIWDEKYKGWAVEDIYDDIDKCSPNGGGGQQGDPNQNGQGNPNAPGMPKGGANGNDMAPAMSIEDKQRAVNNVIQAAHMAVASGNPGAVPGSVVEHINKFLDPVVPWEVLLDRFLEDRCSDDYSWSRPNRRYGDMYMPSLMSDDRLAHLIFYQDVSGSISPQELIRFNSEVRHIKDKYNPDKLTLVQFDTKIQTEVTYEENDAFDEVVIVGRGGTCLKEVRQHMMDNNPNCAVVFSDMLVAPMEPGPKCPILWIAVSNKNAQVPFGQLIHINP